jgi:exosortase
MQSVKAIILVGNRDFGRCPIASSLPTALWPIAGKSVLERLLSHLADQGIKQAVVCGNDASSLVDKRTLSDNRLALSFFDETLPVGTAGCIREALSDAPAELFVVLPAGIVCPPEIDVLIKAHRDGQSDLTVMLNPDCENGSNIGQASGIYVCNSSVLEHIPEAGYFDIKEGLIPEMLRAGKSVHAATLPNHAGNFRDWRGYLFAVADYLAHASMSGGRLERHNHGDSGDVWIAAGAKVSPEARIHGPVVIMGGAGVESGAVILGPAILGSNTAVGAGSVVIDSVLWEGARAGRSCEIRGCVMDRNAVVRNRAVVEDKAIAFERAAVLSPLVDRAAAVTTNGRLRLERRFQPLFCRIRRTLPAWIWADRKTVLPYLASGLVLMTFIWSYRSGLADLWSLWWTSDEYSSGLLVPFLALYVLWTRRHSIARCPVRPSLWGLVAFAGAQALRLFGLFFMYNSAERASIVLSLAALVLLLFGWQLFRKVSPILLFLCLMLPWPNLIQYYVGLHLQRWATSSAVFCLEMVGYEVIREGSIIHIGRTSVEVAYACNGLRMITAFFVISGLVVLLVDRAWWEKLVVLASSLPIALVCNTIRLTVTAIVLANLNGQFWDDLFHDCGGYAMMPLALAAVVGELWLLRKLTTLPEPEEPIVIGRQKG